MVPFFLWIPSPNSRLLLSVVTTRFSSELGTISCLPRNSTLKVVEIGNTNPFIQSNTMTIKTAKHSPRFQRLRKNFYIKPAVQLFTSLISVAYFGNQGYHWNSNLKLWVIPDYFGGKTTIFSRFLMENSSLQVLQLLYRHHTLKLVSAIFHYF